MKSFKNWWYHFTMVFRIIPMKWTYPCLSLLGALGGTATELFFPLAASQIVKYASCLDVTAYYWVIALFVVQCLCSFFYYLNYHYYSKNGLYFCSKLHEKYYDLFKEASDSFARIFPHGKILNTVLNDTMNFPMFVDGIVDLISCGLQLIVLVIIFFSVDWITAIVVMISCFLYALYILKHTKKLCWHLNQQKKEEDAMSQIYQEELTGLKEVRSLGLAPSYQKKLNLRKKRYASSFLKRRGEYVKIHVISDLIPYGTKVLLYLLLVFFLYYRGFSIDLLILLVGYYESIITNIIYLIDQIESMSEYYVSIQRVKSMIDSISFDESLATKHFMENEIYGSIVFDHVTFVHDSRKVLNQVSFEVKPNQIVAIVGPSGSGKSLLFRLLTRFERPKEGTIYLDGRDIYDYSPEIYGSNITLVRQNPFLFHMSIQNNFRLVNSKKAAMIEACQRVGIHDFIMSLPKGYHTVLQNDASNVSGGQKQLLSIARALVTDAEILLLDDVTSSLDPHTSNQICKLLKDLQEDHTILAVTNRENILQLADQILYLEHGTVTAYSTYAHFIAEHDVEQLKEGNRL